MAFKSRGHRKTFYKFMAVFLNHHKSSATQNYPNSRLSTGLGGTFGWTLEQFRITFFFNFGGLLTLATAIAPADGKCIVDHFRRTNMGALIATKGTRRLIKQLNTAFSKVKMGTTKATIDGDTTLSGLFSTPSGTAPIIQSICNNTKGKKLFLPPNDSTNHKNLLKRWDYYLGNELSYANHELIRGFIWSVINGPNGLQGANASNAQGDVYTAIRFDCVEGPNQTVLQSDEYHLKNGDKDDTGLSAATAYSKIVLVTAPTAAPIPRDNQF